jgi:hypothetical protein
MRLHTDRSFDDLRPVCSPANNASVRHARARAISPWYSGSGSPRQKRAGERPDKNETVPLRLVTGRVSVPERTVAMHRPNGYGRMDDEESLRARGLLLLRWPVPVTSAFAGAAPWRVLRGDHRRLADLGPANAVGHGGRRHRRADCARPRLCRPRRYAPGPGYAHRPGSGRQRPAAPAHYGAPALRRTTLWRRSGVIRAARANLLRAASTMAYYAPPVGPTYYAPVARPYYGPNQPITRRGLPVAATTGRRLAATTTALGVRGRRFRSTKATPPAGHRGSGKAFVSRLVAARRRPKHNLGHRIRRGHRTSRWVRRHTIEGSRDEPRYRSGRSITVSRTSRHCAWSINIEQRARGCAAGPRDESPALRDRRS